MALSDLNRPKLKKYSPKGMVKKGANVSGWSYGKSGKRSPYKSNFGMSSNDTWLLEYSGPEKKHVLYLGVETEDNKLGGRLNKTRESFIELQRKALLRQTEYNDATRMMDYLSKRIASIGDKSNPLYDKNLTSADIPGLENSLERWTRKQNQLGKFTGKSLATGGNTYYTTTGGIFYGSQLEDIGGRLSKTFYTDWEKSSPYFPKLEDLSRSQKEKYLREIGYTKLDWLEKKDFFEKQAKSEAGLGEFRKNLAEKFNKKGEIFNPPGNSFFNPNIKFVEVPKRHKPSTVNYFTDHDVMGFSKNMQIGESKFIGITEDGKNYKYPDTYGLVQRDLRIGSLERHNIPAVDFFTFEAGGYRKYASGFTKFQPSYFSGTDYISDYNTMHPDKSEYATTGGGPSKRIGAWDDNTKYNMPSWAGANQPTFRLGMEGGRTVIGLGNVDSFPNEGVDYFSGNKRVGADGIHTLPLGFWKNIGKDNTELPHNSRSQLAYMVTEGDLAGKYVFGFGPPTSDMAVDSPHMWQLSSKSIIPDVPNTWDVRGQTMWDQMGEYPWAAYNQPSLQSKGVNFMAGTKKGKTFNPDQDLHPYGFTTNMGKLNWQTGDPNTGVASRLAIPIDENGDRSNIKISANLDGMDGYDFPYPGQGSWHIRKHYRRRFTPPLHNGAVALGQSGTHFNLGVRSSEGVVPLPNSYSPEDYPIYSSVNLADDDEVTRLNTMIGASTYKVPKIGSELARKFVHPTNAEGGTYGKFGYINHYWEWKNPHKIREEAGHGSLFPIHPIIYKSLLDMGGPHDDVGDQDSYASGKSLKEVFRYSGNTDRRQGAGPTIEFVRGGYPTALVRVDADLHRLFTLLHDSGNTGNFILGKQTLLQALNPREETRVFNPLSFEANATRVVKLQRHISAEGLLNTIKTSFLNPINNFLDPGSVSPVTLGLYERYEGYDWGPKNRRDKGNKLAQWANESFESEETADGTFGDKLKKGLLRGLTKSFTSAASSITGYNLEKSPEPPSRYVDSQKTYKDQDGNRKINIGENKNSGVIEGDKRFASLDYDKLNKTNAYGGRTHKTELRSGGELQELYDSVNGTSRTRANKNFMSRLKGRIITDDVGDQGKADKNSKLTSDYGLGWTSSNQGDRVDKINLFPYSKQDPSSQNYYNWIGRPIEDFIKFRFKDMVNGKFLVFRAILSGINDNITPDWSSERYIGRADQVHVYKGADRNISFNFSIAPKSKTEFPALMEKLSYLMGLCYPDYDSNNSNRMVPPMTELTIGNILYEAPGFLNSLSYTVEESSPWETQKGLQFPKFINVSCDFRYIGKGLPQKYGPHLGSNFRELRALNNPFISQTQEGQVAGVYGGGFTGDFNPGRPNVPFTPNVESDFLDPTDYAGLDTELDEMIDSLPQYNQWDPLPPAADPIDISEHQNNLPSIEHLNAISNRKNNVPLTESESQILKDLRYGQL